MNAAITELCQVADVEARQRLRSSSSSSYISRTRLLTVGDRAFPVAAERVWNSLPDLVTSAPSVAVFRSRLKTHLFHISYPCDCTVPAVTLVALDTIIVLAYFTYRMSFFDNVSYMFGSLFYNENCKFCWCTRTNKNHIFKKNIIRRPILY